MKKDESSKEHKGGYRQISKALNICAFEDFLETQLLRPLTIPDVKQLSPPSALCAGKNCRKGKPLKPSMPIVLPCQIY